MSQSERIRHQLGEDVSRWRTALTECEVNLDKAEAENRSLSMQAELEKVHFSFLPVDIPFRLPVQCQWDMFSPQA